MISHLVVPHRQDLVSLTAALLDSRFAIEQLTLVDWSADKEFVIKAFCQPRGITLKQAQWDNWQQKVDDTSAWLISDDFCQKGWLAEQQAVSSGLAVASIKDDTWVWLANTDDKNISSPSLNLADNLTLEHYFPLFSWEIKSLDRNTIEDQRIHVADQWRKRINYGGKALSTLNYLAMRCRANLKTTLDRQQQNDSTLNSLIHELVTNDMATRQGKNLTFADEDSRFFANGGWLEELTFAELNRLKQKLPKLQDVARNVCIEQWVGDQRFEQELDVVCLYDNQLVVIECKTKNYHKKGGSITSDLKLSLAQLSAMKKTMGPPVAKVVFVSFFELSPTSKARASQWDVEILDGPELAHLATYLKMALK